MKHNHIVPHNLWDPFEGDHCHPGTAFNCKAMCGGSWWESKTGRVNLCEVGGVSLRLNIAEDQLEAHLVGVISIENWVVTTSRDTWTVKPGAKYIYMFH